LVYFGAPGQRLLDFLADINNEVPIHANVPDHVLSIINADFAETGKEVAEIDEMVAKFKALKQMEANAKDRDELPRRLSSFEEMERNEPTDSVARANFGTRLVVLMGRDFKELVRDPGIIGVRVLMYTLLSFVIGVMFLKLGNDFSESSILARTSILFYVGAFMVFMSVAVLPFFVTQRSVFTKERCNGAYGVPEYVLSKFIVSIPGVFILSLIPALLIVLPAELNGFGVYLSTLFLALLMAEAFMSLIAACVPHFIIGIALAAGFFGFFMLCQGFFIVKDDIPDYLIWGYYIAPHTYIFQLFMYVVSTALPFHKHTSSSSETFACTRYNEFEPIGNFNSATFNDGQAVLEFYGIDDDITALDSIILVIFIAGFQTLFGLVLYYWHTGLR